MEDAPLTFEIGSSPAERKANYRRFYDAVTKQLNATEFGQFSFFLNWGYVPDHNPQYAVIALPDYFLNKNSVKLVLEVIGDCVMTDRRVLDVGCGRGGTAYVIRNFFAVKSITGIDLSAQAISFCTETYRYPGVSFLEGDAEYLPFKDGSFDVVTNIESSHSYPDIKAFYAEVFRVLTNEGYFLYTDLIAVPQMREYVALLKDTGFIVERDQDITSNVLLSSDQIASSRVQAFGKANDAQLMNEFLCLPGSYQYNEMATRASNYRILKLRKDARKA